MAAIHAHFIPITIPIPHTNFHTHFSNLYFIIPYTHHIHVSLHLQSCSWPAHLDYYPFPMPYSSPYESRKHPPACMATPHSCRFINTIGNPYFLCQPNHLYFNLLQLAILLSRTLIKDPVNADHVDEVSLIDNATTAAIIVHQQRHRRAPLCLRCLQGVHPRLCPLRQWPSHRSSFAVSGEFKTKRTWMRLGRL